MKYIKLNNIIRTLFVIVFFDMLLLTQTVILKSDYVRLVSEYEYLTFAFIGVLLIASLGFIIIKLDAIKDILIVVGPFIFILVVSLFEVMSKHEMSIGYTLEQNMIAITPGICGYLAIRIFGKEAIDLITYACLANYSIYVVMYLTTYGFFGITHFFQISDGFDYTNYLEVHEVTFIMGLLLIYYCLDSFKNNKSKIYILALYVFLGYKRILFPAIAIGVVVGLIIMKREKKYLANLFSILSFLIVTVWLFFVTSPFYELAAMAFNIELNSRSFSGNGIYGRLDGYYDMGVSYIGHGVGFVLAIMQTNYTGGTVGFHNDILKYYIDLGFIPFFVFIIMRVFIVPMILERKQNYYSVALYISTLMMTLICWTTDNLASYPNYLFVSFVIIAYAVAGYKKSDVGSIEK